MKRGIFLLLLFIVACTSAQYAGEAGRGASGLQKVQPSAIPQQQNVPSRTVQPIAEGPPQTLSIPGSRAGARGCVATAGQACNRNQCGGTGVVDCKGVCSAVAPSIPANMDQSCGCGGKIGCDGQCISNCPQGQSCISGQCFVPCACNGIVFQGVCQTGCPYDQQYCRNDSSGSNCVSCVSTKGQPCNVNQCGGSGTTRCDGSCAFSGPAVPPNFGQACGCGGAIQCNGACSKAACPSGQACQNNQCVQVKQGYCGSCESNSGCLSNFCYYGSCINNGDQLSGWGNFAYCNEGVFCEQWQKPVRITQANYGCYNMFQRNPGQSFTGSAIAFYKGQQVWQKTFDPCPSPHITYISWSPPYLGWVDKLVTYGGGSIGIVTGETSPCSRVTDYFTMG